MNVKTALLRLGQLVLVVLVTWGIVRALAPELASVSAEDFARYRPRTTPLSISTVIVLVFYFFHAWLWRGITTQLGGKQLTYRAAIRIYFLSGLGRYIPGRLWQVAGMVVLSQRAGISAVAATAATVLAQFAFITSGLIYLAVVMPAWGGITPVLIAAAALALVAFSFSARHWAARKVKRLQPAIDMLDRLTVAGMLKWWLAYGLSWIILGIAFVVFTGAFVKLDVQQQRYVAGAIAASYLGGVLAIFSVAGLGVREALMGSMLATVMPAPAALVVAVASRVWFTAGELIPLAFGGNARSSHHSDV